MEVPIVLIGVLVGGVLVITILASLDLAYKYVFALVEMRLECLRAEHTAKLKMIRGMDQ